MKSSNYRTEPLKEIWMNYQIEITPSEFDNKLLISLKNRTNCKQYQTVYRQTPEALSYHFKTLQDLFEYFQRIFTSRDTLSQLLKIDQNGKITLSKKELFGKLNSWDLQIPLLQNKNKMNQPSKFNTGSSFLNPDQNSHYNQDIKIGNLQARYSILEKNIQNMQNGLKQTFINNQHISSNKVTSLIRRRTKYSVQFAVKQHTYAYINNCFFDIYHKNDFLQIFILKQNGDQFFVPIQQDLIRKINVDRTYRHIAYLIKNTNVENTINISDEGALTIKYQQTFEDKLQDLDQVFQGYKVQCDQMQQLEKTIDINSKKAEYRFNELSQQAQQTKKIFQAKFHQLKTEAQIRHFGLISPNLFTCQIKVSSILTKAQECNQLFSFFDQNVKHFRLLFKASQNGFSSKKFHAKCDQIESTLVIVKTQHGNIIGGYAYPPWDSQGDFLDDPSKKSFLFSLTNNDKFELQDAQVDYSILCDIKFGPAFGQEDLCLSDKCDKNQDSQANVDSSYENLKYRYDYQESQKLFSGSKNFKVLEYEVYEVVFVGKRKKKVK